MANTLAFPSTLRADIDKGVADHVSFQIIGAGLDEDIFKIHMYIPQSFQLGDSANFGTIDLGVLKATKDLITDKKENKESDTEAIAIGAAVMKQLNLDVGGSADMAMQQAGAAINQGQELTFEGAAIRTFNFTFIMVAESAEEARLAKIIEHTFRKYMYAKKEKYSVKYPPLFRIKFLHGDEINRNLPMLFDSYLTGLTASYNTQGGNMFHADGSPTDIQLDLSFQEHKQLTRGDLYSIGNVPPGMIEQTFEYPDVKTPITQNDDGTTSGGDLRGG